jgi:S-formylglutathione hydrolase FrmB
MSRRRGAPQRENLMTRTYPVLLRSILFCGAAAVALLGLARTAAAQHGGKGRVETVTVHGKALEGNLSGEPADREVSIYLPPSYDREKSRRYPVVILLHGYSLTNKYWVGGSAEGPAGIDVPGAMDRDITAGNAREMILVMPNGDSKYNGSMYSSSVTSGDWESFIAEDLVSYVDSHYRTIARRGSRGLAGHSMGGYGTIRIGMKRPDVFSSLYVLSACCLMNDPAAFARRAAAAPAPGSGTPSGSAPAARPSGNAANGSGANNAGNNGNRPRAGGFGNVVNAEAAAWSPNPGKPPTYFDAPGAEGVDTTLVAQKWAANSPLVMLDQYVANLKRYTAIGMDVGLQDTLLGSNQQLDKALAASGVQHTFATYEGDHVNHISDRMEQAVLPFFSEHLSGNVKR